MTPTEWAVAHAVKHGMSNREIARRRGISADAVKFHVGNALSKLGFSSRRQLRKWFQVPQGSALEGKGVDMQKPFVLGRIGQISRAVSDIAQAETWYGTVLGLKHLFTFGKLAFFDCDGVRLLLNETTTALPAESLLYLWVEDIERAYAELKARGVEFTHAPHLVHRHGDGTEEWMGFFNHVASQSLRSNLGQCLPPARTETIELGASVNESRRPPAAPGASPGPACPPEGRCR